MEALLTQLQNQEALAWFPGIWQWPHRAATSVPVMAGDSGNAAPHRRNTNRKLLELALASNLAVYDTTYLMLAMAQRKLRLAAEQAGLEVIAP
jgi:hypothetical protein